MAPHTISLTHDEVWTTSGTSESEGGVKISRKGKKIIEDTTPPPSSQPRPEPDASSDSASLLENYDIDPAHEEFVREVLSVAPPGEVMQLGVDVERVLEMAKKQIEGVARGLVAGEEGRKRKREKGGERSALVKEVMAKKAKKAKLGEEGNHGTALTEEEKRGRKAAKKERQKARRALEKAQSGAAKKDGVLETNIAPNKDFAPKKEDIKPSTETSKKPAVKQTPVPVPSFPKPKSVNEVRRSSSMSESPVPVLSTIRPRSTVGLRRDSSAMSETPVPAPRSVASLRRASSGQTPIPVPSLFKSKMPTVARIDSSMSETPVPVPSVPSFKRALAAPIVTVTSIGASKVEGDDQDEKETSKLSSEEKAQRKAAKRERKRSEKQSEVITTIESTESVPKNKQLNGKLSAIESSIPAPSRKPTTPTKSQKKAKVGPIKSEYFSEPTPTKASLEVTEDRKARRKKKIALRKAEALKPTPAGLNQLKQEQIQEITAGAARLENWSQKAESVKKLATGSGLPDDLVASLAKAREAVENAMLLGIEGAGVVENGEGEKDEKKKKRKRKRNHNLLNESGEKGETVELAAPDETIVDEKDEVAPAEADGLGVSAKGSENKRQRRDRGRKPKVEVPTEAGTAEVVAVSEETEKPKLNRRDRGRKSVAEVSKTTGNHAEPSLDTFASEIQASLVPEIAMLFDTLTESMPKIPKGSQVEITAAVEPQASQTGKEKKGKKLKMPVSAQVVTAAVEQYDPVVEVASSPAKTPKRSKTKTPKSSSQDIRIPSSQPEFPLQQQSQLTDPFVDAKNTAKDATKLSQPLSELPDTNRKVKNGRKNRLSKTVAGESASKDHHSNFMDERQDEGVESDRRDSVRLPSDLRGRFASVRKSGGDIPSVGMAERGSGLDDESAPMLSERDGKGKFDGSLALPRDKKGRFSSAKKDSAERDLASSTPDIVNSAALVRNKKGRFSSVKRAKKDASKDAAKSSTMSDNSRRPSSASEAFVDTPSLDIRDRRRSSLAAIDRIALQASLEDQASTIFDQFVDDVPSSTVSRKRRTSAPAVSRSLFGKGVPASDDGSVWEMPVPVRNEKGQFVGESSTSAVNRSSSKPLLNTSTPSNKRATSNNKAASDDGSLWEMPVFTRNQKGQFISQTPEKSPKTKVRDSAKSAKSPGSMSRAVPTPVANENASEDGSVWEMPAIPRSPRGQLAGQISAKSAKAKAPNSAKPASARLTDVATPQEKDAAIEDGSLPEAPVLPRTWRGRFAKIRTKGKKKVEASAISKSVKSGDVPTPDAKDAARDDEQFFDTQETAEEQIEDASDHPDPSTNVPVVVTESPIIPKPIDETDHSLSNNPDATMTPQTLISPAQPAHQPNSSRRRTSMFFSPPAKRMKRNKAEDFFEKSEKPLVESPNKVALQEEEAENSPIRLETQDVVRELPEEVNEATGSPIVAKEKPKRPPAKSPYFQIPTASPAKKSKSKATNIVEGEPSTSLPPSTPKKSSPSSPNRRSPGGVVSCIPFPPLSSPTFGLIQEKLAHDPFRLLIAVTFLNRTRGKQAIPVFFSLVEKYPTPSALAGANREDIVDIIKHLGLQNQRAATYQQYAKQWIEESPVKGKRYAVKGYPEYADGRDVKRGEVLGEGDQRVGWEIGHMTQGPYAIDSWRIFCRDELRGLASDWNGRDAVSAANVVSSSNTDREANSIGEGKVFQPEWMRVLPEDKELRAYLRWMWLKEGFEWDPFTGDKDVASESLLRAAEEGRVVWDEMGGMSVLDEVGV
ncbi:DNA-glycosylase [Glarea lozoyensis ATCC 20868]|uniref:DNA-glycosylase n=1 Tax=Glarea lozoyensis (strain ATCC 20868 / MF5171) TaxID=1116229 RepID=S3DNL5_GLAL2|nr:DNA-glycosylase [Glarea lozoyensis ATCC 20868]EPE28068.1 DNA-glycosylase [Glarea lozoyensis ATCC 20868]